MFIAPSDEPPGDGLPADAPRGKLGVLFEKPVVGAVDVFGRTFAGDPPKDIAPGSPERKLFGTGVPGACEPPGGI